MKKILVIICTGFVPWGGLTTVAMNYYRAMNKDGLKIDFASNNSAPNVLLNELHTNGSEYYQLPERKKIIRYLLVLHRILKNYDVVHIHGNSATMFLELLPSVARKIPKRIVHCHNSRPTAKKLSKILRPAFLKMYTDAIAVSSVAGDWLFGQNNYLVLNNAIQVEEFSFNQDVRKEMRERIGIDDNVKVYGHVGKINSQKNHSFLIDIFFEIKRRNPTAVLLLVGDGDLREEVEAKVNELKIDSSVIFLGMSDEVKKWLNAMDCFIFPSHFEGFPLSLTEAQANGLICFAASTISDSARILKSTKFFDLNMEAEKWAFKICGQQLKRLPFNEVLESFRLARLDIKLESNILRTIYTE